MKEHQYHREDRAAAIRRRRELVRKAEMMRNAYEEEAKKEKIQAKLEINEPGDKHEQEADAVAKSVVSGTDSRADIQKYKEEGRIMAMRSAGYSEEKIMAFMEKQRSEKNAIQKKDDEEENTSLMAKEDNGGLKGTTELQAKLDASKGGGESLDDKTKGEMESKMGADLNDVKIHIGSNAHEMAEGINAKAFTHGQDIYFKAGNYNTNSNEGKELLAHELVHTQQQKDGVERKVRRQKDEKTPVTNNENKKKREAIVIAEGNTWVRSGGEEHPIFLYKNKYKLYYEKGTSLDIYQDKDYYDSSLVVVEGTAKYLDGNGKTQSTRALGRVKRSDIKMIAGELDPLFSGEKDIKDSKKNLVEVEGKEFKLFKKAGIVRNLEGVNLRTAPLTETDIKNLGGKYKGPAKTLIRNIPFNTLFTVQRITTDPKEQWAFVTTQKGEEGYLSLVYADIEMPEPTARLHLVKKGEGLLDIAARYRWKLDVHDFANQIINLNSKGGISIPPASKNQKTSWAKAGLKEGLMIWIPGEAYARTKVFALAEKDRYSKTVEEEGKEIENSSEKQEEVIKQYIEYSRGYLVGNLMIVRGFLDILVRSEISKNKTGVVGDLKAAANQVNEQSKILWYNVVIFNALSWAWDAYGSGTLGTDSPDAFPAAGPGWIPEHFSKKFLMENYSYPSDGPDVLEKISTLGVPETPDKKTVYEFILKKYSESALIEKALDEPMFNEENPSTPQFPGATALGGGSVRLWKGPGSYVDVNIHSPAYNQFIKDNRELFLKKGRDIVLNTPFEQSTAREAIYGERMMKIPEEDQKFKGRQSWGALQRVINDIIRERSVLAIGANENIEKIYGTAPLLRIYVDKDKVYDNLLLVKYAKPKNFTPFGIDPETGFKNIKFETPIDTNNIREENLDIKLGDLIGSIDDTINNLQSNDDLLFDRSMEASLMPVIDLMAKQNPAKRKVIEDKFVKKEKMDKKKAELEACMLIVLSFIPGAVGAALVASYLAGKAIVSHVYAEKLEDAAESGLVRFEDSAMANYEAYYDKIIAGTAILTLLGLKAFKFAEEKPNVSPNATTKTGKSTSTSTSTEGSGKYTSTSTGGSEFEPYPQKVKSPEYTTTSTGSVKTTPKILSTQDLQNVQLSGSGRTFNHFTNMEGISGITGIAKKLLQTLKVGQGIVVNELKFGSGSNPFMTSSGNAGEIFITDLPVNASSGKLNQIGVFGERQAWVISFSEETSFLQNAKPVMAKKGIFTIPENTKLNGTFIIQRVR